MASYHRVIGIDLGTTYSAVAAYDLDKSDVRIIPNRQNEPTTPSVVFVSAQGQVSVGRPAKEKLATQPNGVIFEVKRLIGDRANTGGKAMARIGDKEFDPELISAHILKELKAFAERAIGSPIHDAVITVPAYFKEPQKAATMEAAKIARLNPRLLLNEPTAAALAYGLESGEKQTFVVYDLGGGTFDVSIVRVVDALNVEVLGTGGDANLGGGDIDASIVKWALAKIAAEFSRDPAQDTKLVGRIRLAAEQTKIDLCNQDAPQELTIMNPAPGVDDVTYTLSVSEFDAMARPILQRTLEQVEVALASAKKNHELTMDDIDSFILVGGSSKIPAVSRILRERYLKPIKSDLNPDEIVALGAARAAMNFQPSLGAEIHDAAEIKIDTSAAAPAGVENTGWKDVVSHTLGVGLAEDLYDPLIPKDHVIPHKVARPGYTTAKDNQTSILVPVYQGDNPKASLNHLCGQVVLDSITPEPKGHHQFEITFELDANGVFNGQLLHKQTGAIKEIKLDRGPLQMKEKKRLDLAALVDAGRVAVQANDPIDQLVAQAAEAMPGMSPERQREIGALLGKLAQARLQRDSQAQGTAVAALTMLISRG
jgi:molecular chaperone DnaK